MNNRTRQDVIDIIDSRLIAAGNSLTDRLHGELDIAIDVAGLTGAIDLDQQRHYKERLLRIIERDHQQRMEANGRVA